ncbi:tetraspanin-1-like [Hemibagrus wyckioides]|uniref:tetraspanin-1-like n=1 Tax=Hemibagrus wyckioides TaxID=337641 RepID=UPI00266BD75C|nr:tetraspanin-1-like [Hemibagrus wyckioides]
MTFKGILKILMVIFNTAIFFAGAASVVIGVLVVVNKKNVFGTLDNIKDLPPQLSHLANAGYLLVAVGAVIAFMGFLGCCGACCENKCMLMTFFIIILTVFVVEVIAAVLILFYEPKAEELMNKIREKVAKSIRENYGDNDIITNTWNETMTLLKCCGYNNYTDFTGSPYVRQDSQYPQFCCSTGSGKCNRGQAQSQNVDGCFNVVVKLVKNNSTLLGGIAVCVAATEVAAMIVSLILFKK